MARPAWVLLGVGRIQVLRVWGVNWEALTDAVVGRWGAGRRVLGRVPDLGWVYSSDVCEPSRT